MKTFITPKNIVLLYAASILILLSGCKTNKIAKDKTSTKALATLDSLYARDNYLFEIDVAYPFMTAATSQVTNSLMRNTGNTANRIDVSADNNYIKIENDSVTGYLPFFGERRLNSGTYGSSDVSIQFEEPIKNLTKEINANKGRLELEFRAKQKGNDNEKYEIKINIFPNKNISVDISPLFRTFMRYDGELSENLDEE